MDDLVRLYDPNGEGIRLDLGCGYYKKPGFIGLDNFFGAESQVKTDRGPDILIDLTSQPIPFPDSSVTEIFTSHFLEHVPIDILLKEIHRVLKPRGACQIILPYANSAQGMYPGHSAFYTEQWFHLNPLFNSLFSIYKIGWRKTPVYDQLPAFHRWTMGFKTARQVFFNVCDEFTIYCYAKKDGEAGSSEIEEFVYSAG